MRTDFPFLVQGQPPLEGHPNPYFEREDFLSLNGYWDFEMNQTKGPIPSYSQKILVPFAVETEASGIQKPVKKGDVLHYRRTFVLPPSFLHRRVVLHFEAVDQVASVTLNGTLLGTHEGGYLPFSFDISPFLQEENVLEVEVEDDVKSPIYPRGKQSKKGHGIWYTSTSGIYQTVWLEATPAEYLPSVKITPLLERRSVRFEFEKQGPREIEIEIFFQGESVACCSTTQDMVEVDLSPHFHPWSPEEPNLYSVELRYGEDRVKSRFAMRQFGKIDYKGHSVFALNGKPYFLSGPLDQGYFPESGLTPPSVEAMRFDLETMKSYGFNMVRKHIKVEPMQYYAMCDELGLIVMQDFINGGGPYNLFLFALGTFLSPKWKDDKPGFIRSVGRGKSESRRFFEDQFEEFALRFYNVPCVAVFTIFNEAWGQFETKKFVQKLRQIDPTRLIDANSGWCDQGVGDFDSHHVYFRPIKLKESDGRILSLSEFGGYSHRVPGHAMSQKEFGYKRFRSQEELQSAIATLYRNEINPLLEKGLSVAVLTQYCDVEEEINGLLTYDRKAKKVDSSLLMDIHKELRFHD